MAHQKPANKQTTARKTAKSSGAKAATVKKPPAKQAAINCSDFPAVFARLKAILKPYEPRMVVVKDDDTWYYLDTTFVGRNKKPIMFAAVRVGKAYVSYYLMCVYGNSKLAAAMSPALKKRRQGKSCFNFSTIDEALFAELESLTRAGAEWFLNGGLEKMLADPSACS